MLIPRPFRLLLHSTGEEYAWHYATSELHRTGSIGWLRAAVFGANDGVVTTASLILGVAAAHTRRTAT